VNKAKGFTLIELMVVVVIVAILAGIALPGYQEHVRKTRRAQGKADMLALTQRLERTYTTDRDYTAATTICDQTIDSPSADKVYYQLTTECEASMFTITATPQGSQASDQCGTMTIDQLGTKTPNVGADGATVCW